VGVGGDGVPTSSRNHIGYISSKSYSSTKRHNYERKRFPCNDDCQQFLEQSREAEMSMNQNQSAIETFRYRADSAIVNGRPLVAELSLYKNESMLAKLGFPLTNFTHRETLSQFVFATAADLSHFHRSMDNIASIQSFLPNNSVYFYDLSRPNSGLSSIANKVSCAVVYSEFPARCRPTNMCTFL